MLQGANTDNFNQLVPKANNSECQNLLLLPSQIKPVKISQSHSFQMFIFCTIGTNAVKLIFSFKNLIYNRSVNSFDFRQRNFPQKKRRTGGTWNRTIERNQSKSATFVCTRLCGRARTAYILGLAPPRAHNSAITRSSERKNYSQISSRAEPFLYVLSKMNVSVSPFWGMCRNMEGPPNITAKGMSYAGCPYTHTHIHTHTLACLQFDSWTVYELMGKKKFGLK